MFFLAVLTTTDANDPRSQALRYAESLFPILGWITRYSELHSFSNITAFILTSLIDVGWLSGDIVAGLTVGIVVVPQSMSYALVCTPRPLIRDLPDDHVVYQIATLPAEYGLYSAFVGVLIYCVCAFPTHVRHNGADQPKAIRYIQRCLYRSCRGHVPHYLPDYQARRSPPPG